jgi:hypothetical protein
MLYIYFQLGVIGNLVGRTLGEIAKAQENFFWDEENVKKYIMDFLNINVLKSEN